MCETDFKFSAEKKEELKKLLFEEKKIPEYEYEIDRVSYMDGLKIYFKNGGWIIARFSGTEPLIRIFCEMEDMETAKKCCDKMREFLGLWFLWIITPFLKYNVIYWKVRVICVKQKKHTPKLPDYLADKRGNETEFISEKEKLDKIRDGEIVSEDEDFFEKN